MTDIKIIRQSLRATSNINVAVTGVGIAVDGSSVTDGMDVFLTAQDNPAENGPWVAHAGAAWTRHPDFDTSSEMLAGTMFKIVGGSGDNKGSLWRYDGPDNPTVGTTSLTFIRETWGQGAALDGTGIERTGAQWNLQPTGTPTGYFTRALFDEYGRAQDAEDATTNVTFLEGLRLVYLTANSLRVEAGSCYIPDVGTVVEAPADTDITGMSLTASTWYYLYGYLSGGSLAFEVSTQAPVSTPYRGNARVKGPDGAPDSTRRYIGAVYASATNTIRKFQRRRDFTRWVVDINSTARVVSASQATTSTDVDISPWCPPTSADVDVHISLVNTDNPSQFFVTAAGDGLQSAGGTDSAGQLQVQTLGTGTRQHVAGPIALFGGTRSLRHRQTAVGASRSGNIDMIGYWEAV